MKLKNASIALYRPSSPSFLQSGASSSSHVLLAPTNSCPSFVNLRRVNVILCPSSPGCPHGHPAFDALPIWCSQLFWGPSVRPEPGLYQLVLICPCPAPYLCSFLVALDAALTPSSVAVRGNTATSPKSAPYVARLSAFSFPGMPRYVAASSQT